MTDKIKLIVKEVDGKLIIDTNEKIINLWNDTIIKYNDYQKIMSDIKDRLDFTLPRTKGD